QENFDGSLEEPTILPSAIPNLLANGTSGIAVGMATNIAPHNLGEVIDGLVCLIDNPEATVEELMSYIPGPDFPTGAYICGKGGIHRAYNQGKGLLTVRAKTEILAKDKPTIIVHEIPYQVNKSGLVEDIAGLVQKGDVPDISDIRDESDRSGLRIVIELKSGSNPEVVLNQLYKHTPLQSTFGVINLALVDSQPKILNLKELLMVYLKHRIDVIVRRSKFRLRKAEERAHILEGFRIVIKNLDDVIKIIRSSKDSPDAQKNLQKRYGFSEEQCKAILNMRLAQLTRLSQEKTEEEYKELQKTITWLKDLLSSESKITNLIKKELLEVRKLFADERRTQIIEDALDLEDEDLIPNEQVIVTLTQDGYVKKIEEETYREQGRGGRGVIGMKTKEEDFVEDLFVAETHDYVLVFSDKGRIYWLKVHQIPTATRQAKGRSIVNLLEMDADEKVKAMIPIKDFSVEGFLVMATKRGLVKKTDLKAYSRPRRGGIIAILLREGDELIDVKLSDGTSDIILSTKQGKTIRFPEEQVRETGRSTQGVRGIKLKKKDETVGMTVVYKNSILLTVTENGYGKRTPISQYPQQNRGGQGVLDIKTVERNGSVIAIKEVSESESLLMITTDGILIKIPVDSVSMIGRNTMGVRLMKVREGQKIADVARSTTNGE
ncbi:DNA gyrase subunit A, partial [Candidatus Altiarchaeota archaeon]